MLDWYEIVDDGRVQDFMSQFMALLQTLLVRLGFEPLLEILFYLDCHMYHPWVISCVGKPERNYVQVFYFGVQEMLFDYWNRLLLLINSSLHKTQLQKCVWSLFGFCFPVLPKCRHGLHISIQACALCWIKVCLQRSFLLNISQLLLFLLPLSFVSFVQFLFFLEHVHGFVLFMLSVLAIIMSSLPIASRLVIETQYFMSAAMGAREASGKLWCSPCFMWASICCGLRCFASTGASQNVIMLLMHWFVG